MNYIDDVVVRFPELKSCKDEMNLVVEAICDMYKSSGKLLLCGNGGSAADCEHISGELLKGFLLQRKADNYENNELLSFLQKGIAAIPLSSFSSALSAVSNDNEAEYCFAQLVFALGNKNDVFFGLSTSGNSKNIVLAAKTAKMSGLKTMALTGAEESELSKICDITIKVPETQTYKVQELHLPVYHAICAECERILFG